MSEAESDAPDILSPDENTLFRHPLPGVGWQSYDPYRVERLMALHLDGKRLATALEECQSKDAVASFEACERLLGAAREAFRLPPVSPDGAGFTEAVVDTILKAFLVWRAGVKKNSAPTA